MVWLAIVVLKNSSNQECEWVCNTVNFNKFLYMHVSSDTAFKVQAPKPSTK